MHKKLGKFENKIIAGVKNMKIETIEKIWTFEKKIEIFTAGVKNFENWEN